MNGRLTLNGMLTRVVVVILLCGVPLVMAQKAKSPPKKQHKTSNAPFLKPAEAVAKMSIPEGFEVSIFASEPDIAEPIAFCFTRQSRVRVQLGDPVF